MSDQVRWVIEYTNKEYEDWRHTDQVNAAWGYSGSYNDQIIDAVVSEARERAEQLHFLKFRVVEERRSFTRTVIEEI